jgi:hypothetical protein
VLKGILLGLLQSFLCPQSVLCIWQSERGLWPQVLHNAQHFIPNQCIFYAYIMVTLFHVTIIKSPRDQPPPRKTKV